MAFITSYLVLRHKIYPIILFSYWGLPYIGACIFLVAAPVGKEALILVEKVSLTTAMMTTFGLLQFTKNYLNIERNSHPVPLITHTIFIWTFACLPDFHILNNTTMGVSVLNTFLELLATITALASIFLNIFSGFPLFHAHILNRYYLFAYTPILVATILFIGGWFVKRCQDFNTAQIIPLTSVLITIHLMLFPLLKGFKFKAMEMVLEQMVSNQ